MITVYLQGGLGNQLFQIFTAMAYSMEHGETLIFPAMKQDEKDRPLYWGTLLKRLKDSVDAKQFDFPFVEESGFHYTPIPKKSNITIVGYFQSPKYFDKYSEQIMKKLNIKVERELIKSKYLQMNRTISLHFRIGDYVGLQLHHNLLPDAYYTNAIQEILTRTKQEDWNIIYYCEEKDNLPVKQRMRNIKKKFPELTFYKADDNMVDWEQMLLMSCSDHNIIANSAFSWWGAYFNPNPHKIVCYPDTWFGPAYYDKNTKDLCPPNWKCIPIKA